MVLDRAGVVPKPLQLYSTSDAITEIVGHYIEYFFDHPKLSPKLLAHIRMLVAHSKGYDYCIEFNAGSLLMLSDLSDEDIDSVLQDPTQADLEDRETALLLFVLKVINKPEDVTNIHVAMLRDMDWSDQDILDACQQGVNVVGHGLLFKAFKMDE